MAEIIGGPCKTCGFLAVMQSYAFDGRSLVLEASQQTRDGTNPPASWVRCFRAKQDIPAKVEALSEAGVPAEDRLRLVLEEEHECWYEWTPYFDPAWHFEQFRMNQLEFERKKWEAQQEENRRTFEGKLAVNQIRAAVATAVLTILVAVILTYLTIWFTQPENAPNPQPVVVVTQAVDRAATPTPTQLQTTSTP